MIFNCNKIMTTNSRRSDFSSPSDEYSFKSIPPAPSEHETDTPGGGGDPVPVNANVNHDNNENNGETVDEGFVCGHPWLLLVLIFLGYLGLLCCVYNCLPIVSEEERQHLKIPWDLDEAKKLGTVLNGYKKDHYWTLYCAVLVVYIFLQTFAIPGSIFLSILSGYLFPFCTALFLICFCSATGALFCYLLSWLVAGRLVQAYFSEEIRQWTQTVNEQEGDLLSFIIFLRITPLLPNWFINIASPLIGVPWHIFWIGTFFGVAPPSALVVQAGRTLNDMTSTNDHISWTSVIILGVIAIASIIPVLIRRSQAHN